MLARYSEEQLRRIWYALGSHLGTPMYQNYLGEVMREIKDEGMGVGAKLYGATVDASGKPFLSSGARTLSSGQLRFHTDRCDVVGLLCVRQASEGGISKLASSATVYNEILKRRPDLHALLCSPFRAAASVKSRAASMWCTTCRYLACETASSPATSRSPT